MPDYTKGKIYKIYSPSKNLMYIGSTTRNIAQRMAEHVSKYKQYKNGKGCKVSVFQILECEDYIIELIELFPCNNSQQLTKKEGEHIKILDCVNKKIEGRTKKEYREDNKEQIKQKDKQYRETNKEKISNQKKEYREANKEDIKEYNKEYREANKEHYKQYDKERSEQKKEYNKKYKEANKERLKEYRESNKEQKKQYYKQYRESNKEEINKRRRDQRKQKKEETQGTETPPTPETTI